MSSVTKMQLFDKIRQLPRKSSIHFLTIAQIICNDVTNKFASERGTAKNYDRYGHGIYWFDVPAAILGKWRREGLVHKAGTIYRQYFYELSDLLKDFKIREYQRYVNNYNFYKDNLGIIETVFEEQEVSQDERDFWVSHFYQPIAKLHFVRNKAKDKEARKGFDIGDEVYAYTKNRGTFVGRIVKLNPIRAVVKNYGFGGWKCRYSHLQLRSSKRCVA